MYIIFFLQFCIINENDRTLLILLLYTNTKRYKCIYSYVKLAVILFSILIFQKSNLYHFKESRIAEKTFLFLENFSVDLPFRSFSLYHGLTWPFPSTVLFPSRRLYLYFLPFLFSSVIPPSRRFSVFLLLPICQPVASRALLLRFLSSLFSRCIRARTVEAESAIHSRGARVQGEWHVHGASLTTSRSRARARRLMTPLSRTNNYSHWRNETVARPGAWALIHPVRNGHRLPIKHFVKSSHIFLSSVSDRAWSDRAPERCTINWRRIEGRIWRNVSKCWRGNYRRKRRRSLRTSRYSTPR